LNFTSNINNITQANQFLVDCLQLNNTVTAAQLQTELAGHLNYANNVVTQMQSGVPNYTAFINGNAGALTAEDWAALDLVADSLEAHYNEDIVRLWNFAINASEYTNIFGVVGDY